MLSSVVFESEAQQQTPDELIITLTKSGGYEGTAYTATITSDELSPQEKEEVRKLIAHAHFYELPEEISSSERRCFDCGQISISIRDNHRTHVVFVDHDMAETPPALKPLEQLLFKKACEKPEFKCPRHR